MSIWRKSDESFDNSVEVVVEQDWEDGDGNDEHGGQTCDSITKSFQVIFRNCWYISAVWMIGGCFSNLRIDIFFVFLDSFVNFITELTSEHRKDNDIDNSNNNGRNKAGEHGLWEVINLLLVALISVPCEEDDSTINSNHHVDEGRDVIWGSIKPSLCDGISIHKFVHTTDNIEKEEDGEENHTTLKLDTAAACFTGIIL